MSEANTIIQAIQTVIAASMSYLQSVTTYKDIFKIEEKGLYPFLNIDCDDMKVTNADNLDRDSYERHLYPVKIIFGNRNEDEMLIKTGSVTFKSLFDIFDDLRDVIKANPTFSGAVHSRNYRPDFTSDVEKQQDGKFWIGRAMTIFEVYKDIFIK